MNNRRERQDSIPEVFRRLGLETEEEREHFRRLADLGSVGKILEVKPNPYEPSETQNNTAKDDDAKLEPTP